MKKARRALIAFALFALVIAAAAGLAFLVPWLRAATRMPADAELWLRAEGGGDYTLGWTAAEGVGDYRISVAEPGAEGEEAALLSEFDVSGSSTLLSGLPEGRPLLVTVASLGRWQTIGGQFLRLGEDALTVELTLDPLEIPSVEYTVNDEDQTLELRVEGEDGLSYELYRLDGEDETLLKAGGELQKLSFGEGRELPMPERGEEFRFVLRAVKSSGGCTVTGLPSESVAVDRQALLPGVIELECEELGSNRYRLNWNETKGDGYEVQQLSGGDWLTLAGFGPEDEREYLTGALASCMDYSFRVVTVGGEPEEGEEFAAQPASLELRTELCSLYCTVWPLTELAFYSEPDFDSEQLGSIAAGTTLTVLGEENGLFNVRCGGQYGYIDSNYCLINLPEYMGDLISYNITNSYSSLYTAHGYEIPEVTGEVIVGYASVQQADGSFLAPYLYPCCAKLYEAANAAIEQGCRLKIYDSFRPNWATLDIFEKAAKLVDEPVPELDIYGEVPELLPELAEGEELTYIRFWEDGTFGLPNFLAQYGSMHNMGIALDLTLEDLSGEELEMQTVMHDLSIYSVIYQNNSNANLLSSIMKGAGFGGLTSEWWHFQDNETREALKLNIYMYNGVSGEGWTADDTGWRYRRADGSFVTGSAEIGGVSYDFGDDGYCEYRSIEE